MLLLQTKSIKDAYQYWLDQLGCISIDALSEIIFCIIFAIQEDCIDRLSILI